ncbi:MAG: SDR family NAD(P)-dependent oxidoreductase [Spirochaetes bacterium]|nr:SDR family NAD(P)-dependent oxidoreductase [Spirochaetota bacterium]
MKLTGNTIVVTGGTSGIGMGLVEKLLGLGDRVITCGRREDRLASLSAKFPSLVVKACDLADEAQRKAFVEWVAARHPAVNVLVNNAGIQLTADLTRAVDVQKVRAELETNVVAPLHLASLFAPLLAGKKGAAIVNISSGLAFCPLAFMPVYCASKAAMHSLTLSMRRQLRDLGIAVYEIAPPSVDTELGRERRPAGQAASHGGMPIGEFVDAVLKALEAGVLETAIGQAEGLRTKRESLFESMNR